jgi:cytochrome P450
MDAQAAGPALTGQDEQVQEPSFEELLETFDLFNTAHADVVHDFMKYARAKCPVPHTKARGGQYLITRYDDVRRALTDYDSFSSHGDANVVGTNGVVLPPIDEDPPQHHQFRQLLNPYFHPRRLAAEEPTIRDIARKTISPWLEAGHCDLIADFASPFVTDVLAQVIFDQEDTEIFRRADEFVTRTATGEAQAFLYFRDVIAEFVDRRRDAGVNGNDIISKINSAVVNGRKLTDAERTGAVMILFGGGLDTTKVAIGNIVAELARDKRLEGALRQPGWERHVVDEFLRHDSPVVTQGRIAAQDIEIGGQCIRAGDRIAVHIASANRDETIFEHADELDFARERNPHLAFGLGVHRCIGMHLARLQIKVAIEELLRVITDIRIAPNAVLRRHAGVARVYEELPIEFERVQ